MNKEELIDAIAARTKLTKKDSCKALESMIVAVSSSLRRGYPVQLTGFGSLEVHQHKARSWRSRSGKTITIPAHKTVFFHPGVDLKEMINE